VVQVSRPQTGRAARNRRAAANRSRRATIGRGAPGTGLVVDCDPGNFGLLRARAQGWDEVLDAQLRRELEAAARPAARRAARRALRLRLPGLPPARRRRSRSTGLRSELAQSVHVALQDSAGGVGWRIYAAHPMAFATNSTRFRHPVHGDRDVWVSQASQPWWNLAMQESTPGMRLAGRRALERAVGRL